MKGPRVGSLSITYIYPFWVAVGWAGRLAKVLPPQESLHAYKSPLNGFHLLPISLAAFAVWFFFCRVSVEGNKSFEQQLHNKDLSWGYHLRLARLTEGK